MFSQNEWKIAKVVPLQKGGDLNDVNDYRPISILACVSKILEKAVNKHVYSYLIDNKLLNPNQSGFRPIILRKLASLIWLVIGCVI